MAPSNNTFASRAAIARFFALAQTERVAVVGLGNSNQLHAGDGWDHGFQSALAKRYGLFGSGMMSASENDGNGSGQGYFLAAGGSVPSGSNTGAPSQLAAIMANIPFPAGYYYATNGGAGTLSGALTVITNNDALTRLVPSMTGYTSGGYTASASTDIPSNQAWRVFDRTAEVWLAPGTTAYVQIQFPSAKQVYTYAVTFWDFPGGQPSGWQFQGSNDGVTWTTLDTRTGLPVTNQQRIEYTPATTGDYAYYRLNVTGSYGDNVVIRELELYGPGSGDRNSPWDARDGLTVTQHYGTFPTGTGSFTPSMTRTGNNGYLYDALYDVALPAVNAVTGTYSIVRTEITLPPNVDRTGSGFYTYRPYSTGQGLGSGLQFLAYSQFEQPARTTGCSYGTLAFYGGQPLKVQVNALLDASNTALTYYIAETRRPLGVSKAVLFVINEAQNSRNDSTNSVGPSPAPGNTPAGFADNCQAVINRVKAVYALNGWDTANLYFLFIADHALSDPDDAQIVSYRNALATVVCPANPRTASVDLSQLVTGTEMLANGYYADNGNDHAHLAPGGAGYAALALKIVDGLSANGDTASDGGRSSTSGTATITVVARGTGAAVQSATVRVKRSGFTRIGMTSQTGSASLPIDEGLWDLLVAAPTYRAVSVDGVNFENGSTVTVTLDPVA